LNPEIKMTSGIEVSIISAAVSFFKTTISLLQFVQIIFLPLNGSLYATANCFDLSLQ